MNRGALLYAGFITALVLVAVVIPLMVHKGGSGAVGGWRGMVNPGPISRAHQQFADQCETCHTPHQGVEAATCMSCHANTDFGSKQSTRFHAEVTQCTSCHVEHEGDRGIVRMDHQALLRAWVDMDRESPSGPDGGEPPARISTPSFVGGMRAQDPLGVLNCASCHAYRDPHEGRFGSECSSCHTVESWSIPSFRHPSVSSTQCSQCHQAPPSHYMGHFEMVSRRVAGNRAEVEQCGACHTTDSWNNIRGVGFYDHH